MRRTDREVTDREAIRSIIDRCTVLRLGLFDPEAPDFPYIVPMSFGWTEREGQLSFYIHGARAGRRWDLLQKTDRCAFEMDCCARFETVPKSRSITMRYRSVMGTAKITLLEGDAALSGIETVVARDPAVREFDWDRSALAHTAVWRLDVLSLSAKRNRSASEED